MSEKVAIIKKAIEINEFEDCLTGRNGYMERDRFDSNTINYQKIMEGLYYLHKEMPELHVDKLFSDFMNKLDYSSIETIYIVALYLFEVFYSTECKENTFIIDEQSLCKKLSEAVRVNKEILQNTDEIRSLGVDTNVYNILREYEETCYRDTKKHIFTV